MLFRSRALTLEYLRAIEPSATVRFHVDVAPVEGDPTGHGREPRARGVARVTLYRAYNFRS